MCKRHSTILFRIQTHPSYPALYPGEVQRIEHRAPKHPGFKPEQIQIKNPILSGVGLLKQKGRGRIRSWCAAANEIGDAQITRIEQ